MCIHMDIVIPYTSSLTALLNSVCVMRAHCIKKYNFNV